LEKFGQNVFDKHEFGFDKCACTSVLKRKMRRLSLERTTEG